MNTVLFAGAAAMLFYFGSRAYRNSQESFEKAAYRAMTLNRNNIKFKEVETLADAASDNMNVRSNANRHNPVIKNEVGPFGIPREIRREPKTDVDIHSFGRFFDQL